MPNDLKSIAEEIVNGLATVPTDDWMAHPYDSVERVLVRLVRDQLTEARAEVMRDAGGMSDVLNALDARIAALKQEG